MPEIQRKYIIFIHCLILILLAAVWADIDQKLLFWSLIPAVVGYTLIPIIIINDVLKNASLTDNWRLFWLLTVLFTGGIGMFLYIWRHVLPKDRARRVA